MDKLSKLFGSVAFVRVARMFLLHPTLSYSAADVRAKTKIDASEAKDSVKDLAAASVIKRRGKKWTLNSACSFLEPLKQLLIGEILNDINLSSRIERCGSVKLLVAAGLFLNNTDTSTDILIVADRVNADKLRRSIASIEADIGSEVRYAIFSTTEFSYRVSVNDRLIRDVLDYPHTKIINKILPA